MVRTYRDALESRYEMEINGKHHAIPWMICHAAAMISRFRVGKDGRSAMQRLKGKRCRKGQGEFGECVMYLNNFNWPP